MAEIDLKEISVMTWTLIALILGLVILPVIFGKDPDIPPMALQFQSSISQTRKPTESAVYRSQETPHGFPLREGLNIKQSYSMRDGDVRDIWNLFTQEKGSLFTVLGVEKVPHDLDTVSKEIDVIGSYIKSIKVGSGRKKVAVYLPNTVENIIVGFACAFYDFTFTPIPYPLEADEIETLVSLVQPDIVIHAAGTVNLEDMMNAGDLRHAITVVEEGSRHMDFSSPDGARVTSVTWHELADAGKTIARPENVDEEQPAMRMVVRDLKKNQDVMVHYTHRNIVSAVAAQMSALPRSEKLSKKDVFLPCNSLDDQFARIVTYAAMASGCTVALNSVAGSETDLEVSCRVAGPTVIVTSPNALYSTHKAAMASHIEIYHEIVHWYQMRTIRAGRIPGRTWYSTFNAFNRPELGHNLRLVITAENPCDATKGLSSTSLSDLRILLAAKVIYSFTYPLACAGAITQTHVHDYRDDAEGDKGKPFALAISHMGSPMASVEVKTRNYEQYKADDKEGPRGEIVVKGPAVVGNGEEVAIGVTGKWRKDGCLELVVQ